jgi:hypothetical protein
MRDLGVTCVVVLNDTLHFLPVFVLRNRALPYIPDPLLDV